MHTGNWWWEKQKKLPVAATIITILVASDKPIMSLSNGDQIFCPVYVTIGNLDAKTCCS